jgi:hypothetical protein
VFAGIEKIYGSFQCGCAIRMPCRNACSWSPEEPKMLK